MHNVGDYTQVQLQESTVHSNVLWAWATGSMSIKRAPGNILGTSILDFAQFQKSIHKKKGREGEGESK